MVLSVPGCPNVPLLEQRLAEALAGWPAVTVQRVIASAGEAARCGMRDSPTLLVNGHDPFAVPGTVPALACRMYQGKGGRREVVPTVDALRRALEQAGMRASRQAGAIGRAGAVGRAGHGRLAPAEGGLRAVQQEVLRTFATTGRPPAAPALAETAARHGTTPEAVLARLHAEDFLRLGPGWQIRAAYPFSAVPTRHLVDIDGGPRAHAMCAIDALGIAAMLSTGVTITSTDPDTGEPVTVTVHADGKTAAWQPPAAVVFSGQRTWWGPGDSPPGGRAIAPAEAVCCGYVNFFTAHASTAAWASAHFEVTGQILGQADALRLGTRIFGNLITAGC
jgi:alkylmercury lyase-like protein